MRSLFRFPACAARSTPSVEAVAPIRQLKQLTLLTAAQKILNPQRNLLKLGAFEHLERIELYNEDDEYYLERPPIGRRRPFNDHSRRERSLRLMRTVGNDKLQIVRQLVSDHQAKFPEWTPPNLRVKNTAIDNFSYNTVVAFYAWERNFDMSPV